MSWQVEFIETWYPEPVEGLSKPCRDPVEGLALSWSKDSLGNYVGRH